MNALDNLHVALSERFGLAPRDDWNAMLERAVKTVGATANMATDIVLERALTDVGLLKQIAGKLTVPESFFFRHPKQLDQITTFIRKRLERSPAATVKLWSAGCSQGEEPLSLAILLRETLPPPALERISILGTDINESVIQIAEAGIYSSWSFRGLSDQRRIAYFTPLNERQFRISPDIHAMVEFSHRSIQEQLFLFIPQSIDVVMFRNVAIYLSKESLSALTEKFAAVLNDGGLLCLSHSDPPISQSDLTKAKAMSDPVYEKRPSRFPAVDNLLHPPVVIPPPAPGKKPSVLPTASSMLQRRVSEHDRGWHTKDLAKLEAELRKAVFLNPKDSETRFWYALALYEANAFKRSKVQLNALKKSLSETDPSRVLPGGSTTAGEMLQTVQSLLAMIEGQGGD